MDSFSRKSCFVPGTALCLGSLALLLRR